MADLLPSLPGMPRPEPPPPLTTGRGLLSGEGYLTLDIGTLRPDDFDDSNVASLVARLTNPHADRASARHARMLLELLRDEPAGLRRAAFAWIRAASGLDLGDEDMEAVERMRPAEQERHFDGELRLWRDRYRAEGHASGLAEGRTEGIASGRGLLLRMATRKFGTRHVAGLADLLDGVKDATRLEEMGEWLIECETSADFIGLISRAGNGRI